MTAITVIIDIIITAVTNDVIRQVSTCKMKFNFAVYSVVIGSYAGT